MFRKILIFAILAPAIIGCAISSNPREGGLFGGIAGLSSGAYEMRVQQREDELNRKQNTTQDLEQKSRKLESDSQEWERELSTEQQRLAEMEENLSTLQSDVNQLEAKSDKQKSEIAVLKRKIKDVKKKLKSQQAALDELNRAGGSATDPDRYRILEQERNRLEDEYKKLSNYSKALNDAAK